MIFSDWGNRLAWTDLSPMDTVRMPTILKGHEQEPWNNVVYK